jgi:very-short-patch-repair endonuclease
VAAHRTQARGSRLGEVHELRHLDDRAVTRHREVPISRPEETVLWMAGMWTHRYGPCGLELAVDRTARTVDLAWRMGLIDGRRIHDLCDRSGGRGRSGIVVLRQVLEERPPEYRPSGSALEDRFEAMLPADLRARLERQVTVGGEGGPIGTVDYRHRERPLIVEINGDAFHTTLTDREADDARYARLVTAGFAVMVVWERDVFFRPRPVVDALRAFEAAPFEPRVLRPTPQPWQTW